MQQTRTDTVCLVRRNSTTGKHAHAHETRYVHPAATDQNASFGFTIQGESHTKIRGFLFLEGFSGGGS